MKKSLFLVALSTLFASTAFGTKTSQQTQIEQSATEALYALMNCEPTENIHQESSGSSRKRKREEEGFSQRKKTSTELTTDSIISILQELDSNTDENAIKFSLAKKTSSFKETLLHKLQELKTFFYAKNIEDHHVSKVVSLILKTKVETGYSIMQLIDPGKSTLFLYYLDYLFPLLYKLEQLEYLNELSPDLFRYQPRKNSGYDIKCRYILQIQNGLDQHKQINDFFKDLPEIDLLNQLRKSLYKSSSFIPDSSLRFLSILKNSIIAFSEDPEEMELWNQELQKRNPYHYQALIQFLANRSNPLTYLAESKLPPEHILALEQLKTHPRGENPETTINVSLYLLDTIASGKSQKQSDVINMNDSLYVYSKLVNKFASLATDEEKEIFFKQVREYVMQGALIEGINFVSRPDMVDDYSNLGSNYADAEARLKEVDSKSLILQKQVILPSNVFNINVFTPLNQTPTVSATQLSSTTMEFGNRNYNPKTQPKTALPIKPTISTTRSSLPELEVPTEILKQYIQKAKALAPQNQGTQDARTPQTQTLPSTTTTQPTATQAQSYTPMQQLQMQQAAFLAQQKIQSTKSFYRPRYARVSRPAQSNPSSDQQLPINTSTTKSPSNFPQIQTLTQPTQTQQTLPNTTTTQSTATQSQSYKTLQQFQTQLNAFLAQQKIQSTNSFYLPRYAPVSRPTQPNTSTDQQLTASTSTFRQIQTITQPMQTHQMLATTTTTSSVSTPSTADPSELQEDITAEKRTAL